MKTEFKDLRTQRVYIRNFINRKYTGKTECILCGNEDTTIIHNQENPYEVSFICDSCRAGKNEEELKALPKVNILKNMKINQKYSHSKDLILTPNIKCIVESALKSEVPLMEFLKNCSLSYKKFKRAVQLYEKDVKPIEKDLKTHFNQLRVKKVVKSRSQN